MEEKVVKGHPVLFSLMLGVLLTLLVSVASAAGTIMELDDTGMMLAQAGGFAVMAVIVSIYMTRGKRSLSVFGFGRNIRSGASQALYYLPLLLIAAVQPIVGGFDPELDGLRIGAIIVFTLLVGFTEESVFRGIIRYKLKAKGRRYYIVFSSVLFGVLHMANALGGSDIMTTVMQVFNALLIGYLLAVLIETTENIIPLILFHFIYDALAMMTLENPDRELVAVSILNVLYLVYGIYLTYILIRRHKSDVPDGAQISG